MFLLQQDVKEIVAATSEDLPGNEVDFELNLNVVSMVNNKQITMKQAIFTIKNRLQHKNPNVNILCLHLIDFLIKNCGLNFIEAIFEDTEPFEELLHTKAKDKTLYFIKSWYELTIDHPLPIKSLYLKLKNIYDFPQTEKQTRLFIETSLPPPWKDSASCERCRDPFTTFNRKHHCRNCGGCFCGSCSSKSCPIPALQIEEDVRVCDTCYNLITQGGTAKQRAKQETKDVDEDLEKAIKASLEQSERDAAKARSEKEARQRDREDEDLQRAIRESLKLSEAPNEPRDYPSPPTFKPEITAKAEQPVERKIVYKQVPVKKEISDVELENIALFCELVERTEHTVQSHGFESINVFDLQKMFASVVPLHSKLIAELSALSERYKSLYQMNSDITSTVGEYDRLLQSRFSYGSGQQQPHGPRFNNENNQGQYNSPKMGYQNPNLGGSNVYGGQGDSNPTFPSSNIVNNPVVDGGYAPQPPSGVLNLPGGQGSYAPSQPPPGVMNGQGIYAPSQPQQGVLNVPGGQGIYAPSQPPPGVFNGQGNYAPSQPQPGVMNLNGVPGGYAPSHPQNPGNYFAAQQQLHGVQGGITQGDFGPSQPPISNYSISSQAPPNQVYMGIQPMQPTPSTNQPTNEVPVAPQDKPLIEF